MVYSAPPEIEEVCADEKHIRENEMKEALGTDYVNKRWIPDEQDLADEAKIFIARDMVKQLNFAQAELEADPSSIERMKAGQTPLIAEDKAWVAQTAWYLFSKKMLLLKFFFSVFINQFVESSLPLLSKSFRDPSTYVICLTLGVILW